MTIYQVPEALRKAKIQKVLDMDYQKISLRVLAEFRAYVHRQTEQALMALQETE